MNKTLIIDGNNCTHRTFWTARNIAGDDDDKLNNFHVYFTLNAIKSYVDMFKPDSIFICWDEKIDYTVNERKVLFPDYKNNRTGDATPHRNNKLIKEFLTALGIPSIYPSKLEADDSIAFLCDTLPGQKIIVSVDKDFLQLVGKNVSIYSPIAKKHITQENFEEAAKCKHHDFLIIKCIQGDKSDNVPGIPKFGKVKLEKFLSNEIKLTDEEYEIYQRNYELFRLDRFKDNYHETELAYYKQQLNDVESVLPDYTKFINLCEQYNINNILNKREVWHNLFFMKSKLLSLFK
jgi:DNA polymerase-1